MIMLDHASATRTRLASTCARCGVGGWHPEAQSCQFQNCGLSVVTSAPSVGEDTSGEGADLFTPSGSAPAFLADVDPSAHFEGGTR